EKQSKAGAEDKVDLGQLRAHQEKVAKVLDDLFQGREGWLGLQQMRGEMRKILEEQQLLQKETERLEEDIRNNAPAKEGDEGPEGKKSGKAQRLRLTPAQNQKRENLAGRQAELGGQLRDLLDKMKRFTEEDDAARGLDKLSKNL